MNDPTDVQNVAALLLKTRDDIEQRIVPLLREALLELPDEEALVLEGWYFTKEFTEEDEKMLAGMLQVDPEKLDELRAEAEQHLTQTSVAERIGAKRMRTVLQLASMYMQRREDQRQSNTYPEVRRAAAQALSQIGREAATEALISALTDAEGKVRQAAAQALKQIGDKVATGALIGALTDASVRIDARKAAAEALAQISSEEAAEALGARPEGPRAETQQRGSTERSSQLWRRAQEMFDVAGDALNQVRVAGAATLEGLTRPQTAQAASSGTGEGREEIDLQVSTVAMAETDIDVHARLVQDLGIYKLILEVEGEDLDQTRVLVEIVKTADGRVEDEEVIYEGFLHLKEIEPGAFWGSVTLGEAGDDISLTQDPTLRLIGLQAS
jgi:hypothetical protein